MAETKPERRSCLNCPSFVPESEVPRRYARAIGSPMCAFYDKPLSTPKDSPQRDPDTFSRIAAKIGTACPSFGKPFNDRPARTYKVAFPSVDEGTDQPGDPMVNTCVSCKNYAPSDIVMSEWGWVTGACAVKGELIPDNNTSFVGRKCGVSEFGSSRTTLLGVTLFPEFDPDFLTGDLINAFKAEATFNPHTYESDKPVNPVDEARGIRAWKKIIDKERPELDTGVFLPIYNLEHWHANDRAKVPQAGDDEHPEDYLDYGNNVYKIAVLWTELDETPAAWGPPGVGKTELARHLAWVMQLPFERISITASTELDDLAGKMHFDADKGTYFQYGRVPAAWQRPGVILLDEPNVGQPDVWQFLRPLTDNSKQLVLDMNEGERISRDLDAYLMMAMNPAWDPRNVGAAPIGDADTSRLMHLFMDLPPEKIEKQIIETRCAHDGYEIPKPLLETVMKIAGELRGLCEQGTLPMSWGPRNNIKVARATKWFTVADAYRIAVADFLEPQQSQMVLDVVKSHTATAPRR